MLVKITGKAKVMALERRGNGIYYYKKEREGDRVVSRYVGKGETAYLFAQLDEFDAEKKDSDRYEEQQRREKAERFENELGEIENALSELVTAHLLTNGYHQTDSREWRRKRNGK